MVNVHSTVGTLVLLVYLVLTVLYVLWAAGRPMPAIRVVSIVAATLLLVQYLLGISLLVDGHEITAVHYLIALAAIITVGLEHGPARMRPVDRSRASMGAIAAGSTFVLVLVAYMIGMS